SGPKEKAMRFIGVLCLLAFVAVSTWAATSYGPSLFRPRSIELIDPTGYGSGPNPAACDDCDCPTGRCYSPAKAGVTGVTPVYEPDGRVFLQTWVNYDDARREALRTGSDLVVLVDVDDATRSRVAQEVGDSAIVCSTTAAEAYKFAGAGVYRYRFDAQRSQLYGGKDRPIASPGVIYQPRGCVNGRCRR
ncbi:MAG TPA: hypothetical protein VGE52_13090, partial [Pirellulales bacterium]